jgi:hypothetical protein
MRLTLLSFLASLLFACSSSATGNNTGSSGTNGGGGGGGTALDANSFCDKDVTQCKDTSVTLDQCKKTFAAFRVSQACLDALPNADCNQFTGTDRTLFNTCFPSCDTAGTSCNGDGTATVCAPLTSGGGNARVVVDCAGLCQANNRTYTGTCGKTFGSQTSTTGKDQCWCQ